MPRLRGAWLPREPFALPVSRQYDNRVDFLLEVPGTLNRGLLLFVSFAIAAGITLFLARDVFRDDGPVREPSGTIRPPAEVFLEPEPALPEQVVVESEPRELAITGLVVDGSREPLQGITVELGEERAFTGPEGSFRFPAALRSRAATLRFLRGGREVSTWEQVLVGDRPPPQARLDPLSEDGLPSPGMVAVEGAYVPERLESIRWTLNLFEESSPPPQEGSWIRVTGTLSEEWGNGGRIRVRGTTRLPEGAYLAASLYFDGLRFLATLRPVEVVGGGFEAFMPCPEGLRLYSGVYEVRVSFDPMSQPFENLEKWQRDLPETDWSALLLPETVVQIFLGDVEQALAEDRSVEEYYRETLREIRRLERQLKSRVEEVLDLGGGWDPVVLRRLLDGSRYELLVAERRHWNPAFLEMRKDSRSGWFYGDLVEDGQLHEERWREFLDQEWRPAVEALVDRHADRLQEKYQEAGARMSALLRVLLEESYTLSRFVVYPPHLPPHPNDFYPDEERVGDLNRQENILRDNYEALQRYRDMAAD